MKKYTVEEILKIMAIMKTIDVDSLDRPIRNGDSEFEFTLGDAIQSEEFNPEEIAEQNELRETIMKAVNQLPPRQQAVIILRFGLKDGVPMTLEDVGAMYGVTRERIRQVELKALSKLKWLLTVKYKIGG